MLTARGIYKSYGDLPILKGIDIQIGHREIACIVGTSGAGKTTLLQLLGTLDRPDRGTIQLGAVDVLALRGKKLAAFRNKQLGFIFQFHQLLPEFSAIENAMLPALIGGTAKQAARKKAASLLDFLGLSHRLSHQPSALSGGEQQRVAVARALINDPEIVLADEPSGNLDSRHSDELHRLFFRLKDEMQQTFVIVTHNPELAEMADVRYVMKDGVLTA